MESAYLRSAAPVSRSLADSYRESATAAPGNRLPSGASFRCPHQPGIRTSTLQHPLASGDIRARRL
ncbi:MAG: hypothetical protein K2Q23_01835 [Bryobacteraceae bacterium]|nr:hypothetical protein [Bryobacteraceae bacterium]